MGITLIPIQGTHRVFSYLKDKVTKYLEGNDRCNLVKFITVTGHDFKFRLPQAIIANMKMACFIIKLCSDKLDSTLKFSNSMSSFNTKRHRKSLLDDITVTQLNTRFLITIGHGCTKPAQ